jgi:hypothetical protein
MKKSKVSEHNCRVCGLHIADFPWGEFGNCPTYEICSCCGVEFGNEDYTVESTKLYREKWKSDGYNWFESTEKPEKWDMEEQFRSIPREFF